MNVVYKHFINKNKNMSSQIIEQKKNKITQVVSQVNNIIKVSLLSKKYISTKSMKHQTQSMKEISPIKLIGSVEKDPCIILDEDSLHERLHLILSTLHTEREQYQQRVKQQKSTLQQTIHQQSQLITQLQSRIQQFEQQTRQLRFNYHQRGAVVDYLKKKVIVIQKKFDSEKQEMLSVVKYLQSRNSQLNEIIYSMKMKQAELNQNIFQLQEKFVSVANQYCNINNNRNITVKQQQQQISKPNTKRSTERTSISQKYDNNNPNHNNNHNITHHHNHNHHTSSHTQPISTQQLPTTQYQNNNTSFNKELISNLFLDDLINNDSDSLAESSIRQKTVKYQHSIPRTRSDDQIDFAQLNHIISLGGTKHIKSNQLQQQTHQSTKGLIINNYGHLTFGDYHQPQQPRQTGLVPKQKNYNYLAKPKLSLPNNKRYPTELNTRRTNKEMPISHQL